MPCGPPCSTRGMRELGKSLRGTKSIACPCCYVLEERSTFWCLKPLEILLFPSAKTILEGSLAGAILRINREGVTTPQEPPFIYKILRHMDQALKGHL